MRILANRILPRAFGAALIVSLVTGFTPTIVLPATTGPSGLPIPRFASLGSDRVNLRKGPGPQYPIVWVYKRRGMPMEIVAEYNLWRQVRDHDNTEGWVQKNLLSGRRTGMVTGGVRNLRRDPAHKSTPILVLTTESDSDKKNLAREAGATGWMVKPFDPERLVATVRKVAP